MSYTGCKKKKISISLTILLAAALLGLCGCGMAEEQPVKGEELSVITENTEKMTEEKSDVPDTQSYETQTSETQTAETQTAETQTSVTGNMASEISAADTYIPQTAKEGSLTVWNVYWNLDGAAEQMEQHADRIENVNFFGAYFDRNNEPFIAPKTMEFFETYGEDYRKKGWHCYLTIVNDKIEADGKSSLKSSELLYALLDDEEKCRIHADKVLSLAKNNGFDGVEIDYENLRQDGILWAHFMRFIDILYTRCRQEELMLRVVIEPSAPTSEISWVNGPVYSVMCYNLYGSHSKPGPKADKAFLESIMDAMEYVPGEVDYALANGGFDWGEDGSCTALTVKAAQELLAVQGAEYSVDETSGAKYFRYKTADGVSHQVWYGDQETLDIWIGWLAEKGHEHYSIWRLGN